MATWARWTEGEKFTAVEMYKAGKKYNEIANTIDKTYNSTKTILRNFRIRSAEVLAEREKHIQQNSQSKTDEQRRLDRMRQKAYAEKTKEERDAENYRRLECHRLGMTDKESAIECGISAVTYHGWRKNRKLPINRDPRNAKYKKKEILEEKRRVLTDADKVFYNYNDNTPRENKNIMLSVAINGSEKN